MAQKTIKSLPQAENVCILWCNNHIPFWVETINLQWKQSTKHNWFTLQTWSQWYKWNSHTCLFMFCKVLYHKNTNMRFLWHHNNVKIDCISQLRYAQFKPWRDIMCSQSYFNQDLPQNMQQKTLVILCWAYQTTTCILTLIWEVLGCNFTTPLLVFPW